MPPYYDDVVYLLVSQLVIQAAPHQSPLTTVYQIFDQHSPLTTLFGVVGYSLFDAGDLGPYVVGASHMLLFIFACALILRRLPAMAIIGIICAAGAIPALRNFATEFRPEPAWATLTALAALAFFTSDIFAFRWKKQIGLGLLVGLAVISKPTTSPITLVVLGTAFLASGLVRYYEGRRAGAHPSLRSAIAGAAVIWAAALVVIAPIGAIIGRDIYEYIIWVTKDISHQVQYRGDLADQVAFYSFGVGGQLMLGQALPICLAVWGLGVGYAALRLRPVLPRIIAVLFVVLLSYAIPSASTVKLVWFGSAFDAILILSTVYLIALLYQPSSVSPSHLNVRVGISVSVCIAGIGLLLMANLREQPSGLLGMDAVARKDMTERTARIWAVLKDRAELRRRSSPTGHISNVMTNAIEPIVGTVISLYGVKSGLPIRGAEFPYVHSLDELLAHLPNMDYVVAGPSYEHFLSGARLGDALCEAMEARPDFARIATIPLREGRGVARIYERKFP
ncbi:hypothetical protein RA307_18570 [Xanthobacteraceae bacterium Astr-EGSB]|uniref:hypothetical protein n=1 Tax=Astrobacterium formosum TaxID=3069710 RepID=UPI0027AFEC66|nr:hypothetical protein [Xanthobacteraceae bacterium Astr-EGSB]